jgi:glycosyltransferase involved in cell wall biosynthesis
MVRWSVGGLTRAPLDSCAVFAERGHDVTLITPDPLDVPPAWLTPTAGLPRVQVVQPLRRFGLLGRHALNAIAETVAGQDVVHLHAPWTPSNVQIARIARRAGVPYVLTIHGMLDDWCMAVRQTKKRLYLALMGRALIDRAAAVHFTAQAELAQARRWFSNPRVVVLPYLFDLSELIELPGKKLAQDAFAPLRSEKPKILFLSRLHPKKGVELLVEAAAILQRENLALEVIIAGDGTPQYLQQLRELVRKHDLEKTVTFIGLVKGPLKLSVFQAADVFVLPTSQENFGLVLPESLACGTPVITTRGVDIWQDIEAAGGIIVERSAPEIARAMKDLIQDPAARAERSRRGRQWVLENLDPMRLAERYERLYRDCIELCRGGTPAPATTA